MSGVTTGYIGLNERLGGLNNTDMVFWRRAYNGKNLVGVKYCGKCGAGSAW